VVVLVAALVFAVVVMIVMILPAAAVVIAVAVPAVIVVEAAARAVPITGVETFAVMARADPARALVRRLRPVAVMPNVVAADRVPIALDPEISWTGFHRTHSVDARWRRRSDLNANRYLAECGRCSDKNGAGEQ